MLVILVFTLQMAFVYFVAQLMGAFMGYGLLILVTPADIFRPFGIDVPELCMTLPFKDLTPVQAVAMEYISTSVLILICGGVWDPRWDFCCCFRYKNINCS